MDDPRPDFTREPAVRFEWERVFRRALIKPPSTKLLGFVMATYADQDGSKIHPGQKRLANVMGTSVSTVDRGQRALEDLGFIEMVRKGHSAGRGSAKGYASEFQLTLPSDLLECVPMLDKDGNHPSPVTSDSDKHTATMTGDLAALPMGLPIETHVNPTYSHVTGEETHVNSAYIHVTHDVPPTHLHQPNYQPINHQGVSVTLSDAHEKNSDEKGIQKIGGDPEWEETYAAASQHLQNLPDHGQAIMDKIRAVDPNASATDRVIAAAMATGWALPGLRDAS